MRGTRNLLCEVYQGRVHHLRARTFCATHAKGVVLFTPPTTATYAPGVAFSNPVDLSAGSSCTRPVPSSRVACLLLPRATTTPSSHTRVPRSAAPPPATRDASMRVLPSCCPGAAIARRGRAARGAYCRPSKNRQASNLTLRGCSGVRQCEPSLPARRSRGLTTPWKHACGRVADNIMRTKAPAPVGRLSIYSRCGRARSSPPELGLQAVVLPVLHLLALRQPLLDLLLLLVAPVLGRVRVGRVLEEVRLEVPIGELWKSGPRA